MGHPRPSRPPIGERTQLDLFRSIPGDIAPRDAQDLMSWPFFSLAKSKRVAPIDFRMGDTWISVEATPEHGMATIWDADVLIWAASQLVQARDAGRQATARLIDELSLGVTSMDPQTLLATEAHRFLSAALHGQEAVHPMQELIWTKVAYALGDMYPKLDGLPPEDQLKLQKRVFDHLWEMPLSDLVAGMDDGAELRRDYTELTRDTNARNQEHRDELRSYENAYDVELRGAVEVVGEIAADIIAEMEARTTGSRPDPSPEQRAASVNMCRNLVYHAMRRPENRSAMRTLHVKASIHATMRWDKERRFKANDWHDFGHATFALTYCDAFLTEGPLRHLVTSRGSGLEDINGCRVASSADDALAIVRKILEDG